MKLRRTGTHRIETCEDAQNERTSFVRGLDGSWVVILAKSVSYAKSADLRTHASYLLACADVLEKIEADVDAALKNEPPVMPAAGKSEQGATREPNPG